MLENTLHELGAELNWWPTWTRHVHDFREHARDRWLPWSSATADDDESTTVEIIADALIGDYSARLPPEAVRWMLTFTADERRSGYERASGGELASDCGNPLWDELIDDPEAVPEAYEPVVDETEDVAFAWDAPPVSQLSDDALRRRLHIAEPAVLAEEKARIELAAAIRSRMFSL